MISWQIYIRNELIAKNLQHEQQTTKRKIDSFLEAASTGKLWGNEQPTPTQTQTTTPATNSAATTTRQPPQQIKARKVPITTRASSLTSRSRSAVTFNEKPSFTTRTQSDIKIDDFFQTSPRRDEQDEQQQQLPERA
jgi:hypothetical protein